MNTLRLWGARAVQEFDLHEGGLAKEQVARTYYADEIWGITPMRVS